MSYSADFVLSIKGYSQTLLVTCTLEIRKSFRNQSWSLTRISSLKWLGGKTIQGARLLELQKLINNL